MINTRIKKLKDISYWNKNKLRSDTEYEMKDRDTEKEIQGHDTYKIQSKI